MKYIGSIIEQDENNKNQIVVDENGNPRNGSVMTKEGVILNFKNGRLHGEEGEPAVDDGKGHIECWRNGVIHKDGAAAIIDNEKGEEYFYHQGMHLLTGPLDENLIKANKIKENIPAKSNKI